MFTSDICAYLWLKDCCEWRSVYYWGRYWKVSQSMLKRTKLSMCTKDGARKFLWELHSILCHSFKDLSTAGRGSHYPFRLMCTIIIVVFFGFLGLFVIYLFHWGCSDVTKGKIWITVYLLMGRNAWSRKKADFYLQTCVASAGWQLEQRHLSVQNEWISFGCFWGKINMETSESWCCSYKATFWAETHFNPKLV